MNERVEVVAVLVDAVAVTVFVGGTARGEEGKKQPQGAGHWRLRLKMRELAH